MAIGEGGVRTKATEEKDIKIVVRLCLAVLVILSLLVTEGLAVEALDLVTEEVVVVEISGEMVGKIVSLQGVAARMVAILLTLFGQQA